MDCDLTDFLKKHKGLGFKKQTEVESKFFDIDVEEIVGKIENLGAKKAFEGLLKNTKYDSLDKRIKQKKCSIKLRTYVGDEGEKNVLLIKGPRKGKSNVFKIREEITVDLKSKKEIDDILDELKLKPISYQEKKRISYYLEHKGQEIWFDIDQYPELPPYLEIEANTVETVKEAADMVGIAMRRGVNATNKQVLVQYMPVAKVSKLKF